MSSLEILSWDDRTGADFLMFLLNKDNGLEEQEEDRSAMVLSERLSGHPLAISHMAGLINRRVSSIQNWMQGYLKNPQRLHTRSDELTALWKFSFENLNQQCRCILGVMAFLMPDAIPSELFNPDISRGLPSALNFCEEKDKYVNRTLLFLSQDWS